MPAARLQERFREVLAQLGGDLEPEELSFAVDFTRLAIRALSLVDPHDDQLRALEAAVVARTGVDAAAAQALLRLALAPEFRAAVDHHGLRAFAARFGDGAASVLREESAEELDVEGFASRYGPSESLLLLDTLFEVAVADGEVSRSDVRRLQQAAVDLGVDPVLVTALLQKHDPRHAKGDLRFPLTGERLVIGRSPGADIVLADPQVAPQHAELVRVGDGWRVVDLGSGRPTVVGGAPVASAPLDEATTLRIGPYALRLVDDAVQVFGERSFSALSVRGLRRRIGDVSLLDDVSFTVFTGEVVALVGPSGAGKTTLLNAISGIAPPDSGEVLLDGRDFHRLLQVDRSLVGMVPQDDLVNPELKVEESLFFSGRLRFPPDVTRAEVDREVDRVLAELDIEHIRESRIGDALRRGISGGQRKRVNLGQELLTRTTRLLFLDEPTSGLDPRASQDIVRLVRQLADRGRIVFLVTHDLTPEVMAQCDHLLVLAPGGRLAWFGPPDEACRYFGVGTPDAIFNRFGDHSPEGWGERFRAATAYRKFVTTREHLLGLEGVSRSDQTDQQTGRSSPFAQLRTLTARTLQVKLRDPTGMAVLAVQPVVLAFVMAVVFPEHTPGLFFMLALSCMWFGMSASVRELISDRVIWQRESRVGVGVLPYVGAKVIVLGAMVALQCLSLSGAMWVVFTLGDHGFDPLVFGAVNALIGALGLSVGMLTSAVWTSSEAAVGTLPLLLIPQIAFSSIMVSLRQMEPVAKALSWVTFQRYSFNAVLRCGDEIAMLDRRTADFDMTPLGGVLFQLGLKFTDAADDMGFTLAQLCGIQGGFSVVMLAIAVAIVHVRTSRAA